MKKISIIGSTGSIGRQALEVVRSHPNLFSICALAAGSSAELFERQINEFKPTYCALANSAAAQKVTRVPSGTQFCAGEQAAVDAAAFGDADIVLVAASGFAGLKYSIAAIEAGKTLALANKETLVCGGEFVRALAAKRGVEILPVDSEHSAIWQCLNFNAKKPFKRLIITASGGPFRGFSREQLKSVTPQMALAHPTWNMGAKITIDSATMLNKGFEVIEAHHLFGADYDSITAVIHPQSIVHSMVEFADGAVMAQLSYPSMKLPIQAAFTYPERIDCGITPLDFSKALSLGFYPIERGEFECFDIAMDCARTGGTMPCVLNAAGEVAVGLFLEGAIGFPDIARIIYKVVSAAKADEVKDYAALCEADAAARAAARAAAAEISPPQWFYLK